MALKRFVPLKEENALENIVFTEEEIDILFSVIQGGMGRFLRQVTLTQDEKAQVVIDGAKDILSVLPVIDETGEVPAGVVSGFEGNIIYLESTEPLTLSLRIIAKMENRLKTKSITFSLSPDVPEVIEVPDCFYIYSTMFVDAFGALVHGVSQIVQGNVVTVQVAEALENVTLKVIHT